MKIRVCDCWNNCGSGCPFQDTEMCGAYMEKEDFLKELQEKIEDLKFALDKAKTL